MAAVASRQSGRVLSIQSHVVYGYVGGKAAVFPLQCLGYDVDVVHTVNFSNHVGYGRFGGTKTNAAELDAIFESMRQNELLLPSRLLTGYTAGADSLQAVAKVARELKDMNPNLVYLLDPVLGDAGRLYVSPDTIPVYRSMLPLSTVITPNWFEVETLTDINLTDLASLRSALRVLHDDYKVPNVVISSIPLRPWLVDALPGSLKPVVSEDAEQYLLCVSSSSSSLSSPSIVHARCVPMIPGYFSGVGDLFSALLLAHFDPSIKPRTAETAASHAASFALAKTHAILRLTDAHAMSLPEDERQPTDDELDRANPCRQSSRMRGRELRLIQGQNIIRQMTLSSEDIQPLSVWSTFW